MGYFTYKIVRDVEASALKSKVLENLSLFEAGALQKATNIDLFQGHSCSALKFGHFCDEDEILFPIGRQLGHTWIDVHYQDGDAWEISLYHGLEWKCNHNINPWVFGAEPGTAKAIDHRTELICQSWPEHAESIRNYLNLWQRREGDDWVPRLGKAYPTDEFEYGDGYQIFDLAKSFGIIDETPLEQIEITI